MNGWTDAMPAVMFMADAGTLTFISATAASQDECISPFCPLPVGHFAERDRFGLGGLRLFFWLLVGTESKCLRCGLKALFHLFPQAKSPLLHLASALKAQKTIIRTH